MAEYCWFHYHYRDAGNWKTPGRVLFEGKASAAMTDAFRATLEPGDLFVAEQVGIPPLQREHLAAHCVDDSDGDDIDHAFHEFIGLERAQQVVGRTDTTEEIARLLDRFVAAGKAGWDVRRSPFGRW